MFNTCDNMIAATKTFSPYQLKVINLMSHVQDDQEMSEISDLLSNYFAGKAIREADRLWSEGMVGESTIEEWRHEHMRTSY